MALRGKPPTKTSKRIKALFFGEAGAGKTTAAIQFPRPYVIDTEKGSENDQYVDKIVAGGGAVWRSNDWDEIVAETRSLLSEKHEYRTLVIDPITTIYDDALDKAEDQVGTDFGKHHQVAKKDWRRLARLLSRLDMNVIITAHAKREYISQGRSVQATGNLVFEGPKGLDYLFDLVFEVRRHGPSDRQAVVRKSRMAGFTEGEPMPFSYGEIADRYGREVLEREAVAIELPSEKQIAEFTQILNTRKDADAILAKILKLHDADGIADVPARAVVDYIARMKAKHAANGSEIVNSPQDAAKGKSKAKKPPIAEEEDIERQAIQEVA